VGRWLVFHTDRKFVQALPSNGRDLVRGPIARKLANDRAGALLRSWWALILIDGLVTNAATRIALSANTIEQIIFGSGLMIFSDAISTATCWVALQLVRQITAFQSQSFRRLTGAVTPEAAA
jgi:hypothetical protein